MARDAAKPTLPDAPLPRAAGENLAAGWRGRALAGSAGLIAARLPRSLGYWLADRLGDLWYHRAPRQRAAVLANLRRVLPAVLPTPLAMTARRVFRHSARNFYELARVQRLSLAALAREVTVQGSWLPVEAALASGTGVIVVFAHLGAFDAVLQLLPLRGYRATAVTAPAGRGAFHQAVTRLRGGRGLRLEAATLGGLRRLTRALRGGEVVVLAGDRDFQGAGAPVHFCGEATTLPGGAVRLALATGAALVVLACQRQGHRHTLTIDAPRWLRPSADPDADLRGGVAMLAAALEGHIRATPDQWVLFQPVWPEPRHPEAVPSAAAAEQRPTP